MGDLLIEPLTEREIEVLGLMAKGMTNADIASVLVIEPSTVTTHAHTIYQKLAVSNRTEAVVKGIWLGLITLPESLSPAAAAIAFILSVEPKALDELGIRGNPDDEGNQGS